MSPDETRRRLAARSAANSGEFRAMLILMAWLIPTTGVLFVVFLYLGWFTMIWVLTGAFWSIMFHRYFRMGRVEREHSL